MWCWLFLLMYHMLNLVLFKLFFISMAPNITQWDQMTLKVEGDPGYGSTSARAPFTDMDGSETVPLLIPEDPPQQYIWKPLSKEELEKCAGGPEWRKFRSRLVLCFWIIWLIMLGTAIAIIIQSPRAVSPSLYWWQKDVFYHLQPALFMVPDSDELSPIGSKLIKTSFTAVTIMVDCISEH